jgi:hypothetical protein
MGVALSNCREETGAGLLGNGRDLARSNELPRRREEGSQTSIWQSVLG